MNEPCPLTVWESRPPDDGESPTVWTARAKLFDKIGGYWADGLELWAPNYEVSFEPLPYQLPGLFIGEFILEVGKIEGRHDLGWRQIKQQLPERHTAGLGPQVPAGVGD